MRCNPLLSWFLVCATLMSVSPAQVNVVTFHNDNAHTGANLQETVLTPTNVGSGQFGKLFTLPVDGQVYAQPLILSNVSIPGQGAHNVLFVATAHDSVYAFDADSNVGGNAGALWHVSFLNPAANVTTVPAAVTQAHDITPEIGITGSPVIDPQAGILYVIAKTKEPGGYVQRLHALSVATGAEELGGPIVIAAKVPGTGLGADLGAISFDPLRENQRGALMLAGGVLYATWASHGDMGVYHGWVMAFDAQSLRLQQVFCTTPNGARGGIWEAGGSLAADAAGNLYVNTGNGTFDADTGGADIGDSTLRLTAALQIGDWFTPSDQAYLNLNDLDLGSGGLELLPDQSGPHPHLLVTIGKNSQLYVLDRDALGGFRGDCTDCQVVQKFGVGNAGLFGTPAYWNGRVYVGTVHDRLKAFVLNQGQLSTTPESESASVFAFPGATPTVSANGAANGILWAVERTLIGPKLTTVGPAVLHAYDATNLGAELYNSNTVAADVLGQAVKFVVPTVANGKVYVGANHQVAVFGITTFPLSLLPGAQTVVAGATATLTVTAGALGSGATSIDLSCTAGAARCSLAPTTLLPGSSARMTVTGLPPGATPVSVTAVAGTLRESVTADVTSQDYTVAATPSAVAMLPSVAAQVSIVTTALGGLTPGPATVQISGLPVGMTAQITPASAPLGTPFQLTLLAAASVPPATYLLQVGVTVGGLQHAITVPASLAVPRALAVDSGGVGAGRFAPDSNVTGGQVSSCPTCVVDTSALVSPAPPAVYQTQREGSFTYNFVGLPPGAAYILRLHFAELKWTASGQRVFNVLVNGQPLLTNFDVVATAGAAAKAVVEEAAVTADMSGGIQVQYVSVVDRAQSSGLELLPPAAWLAVDAGGVGAGRFSSDAGFTGGSVAQCSGCTVSTAGVIDPAPAAVYQSERYGNFSYQLGGLAPNRPYTVRLHFAEFAWTQPGQRVFSVDINGQRVLNNFDIVAAAGGPFKAVVQEFAVTSDTGGSIQIVFSTLVNNAKCSGIEVIPGTDAVAAGSAGTGRFLSDRGASGGRTSSCRACVISVAGVVQPAPSAVYQSHRFGTFTYQLDGLDPAAPYTLRLHFAEFYYRQPGARIFNVAVNGQPVLDRFDTFVAAGGAFRAVVPQFAVTSDSSGTLRVQFTSIHNGAQVSGLEVTPGQGVALNAGGGSVAGFKADFGAVGGATATCNGCTPSLAGVTLPAPAPVYQSERYGDLFAYVLSGFDPGQKYRVRLHFAEFFYTAVGQRVFNVSINGAAVLTHFDIVAAAGSNAALVKEFTVPADAHGVFRLLFQSQTGGAKLSGLEILPTGP